SLWSQPDDVIEEALAREMPLMKSMGVNAIRQYVGVPPRWVRYIYERYGIYTVVNHPVGRYGLTLNGVWTPNVDYGNPAIRAALRAEVTAMVDEFRGVPGVLLWLLGNENNYGLAWTSFEAEALPQGEQEKARARQLYSLFGEIIGAVKERAGGVPVAMANGDIQYIDIIAEECKGLDVLGTNVYRGVSARDLFQVVRDKMGVPVLFTEFGADAFDAKRFREDQATQARYLLGQWREIYEQSSGKGLVGNAIGGFIFQWSDGWWKFGQESRLDVHDTNASWPNGGYAEDYTPGENNMNEEWWGICAKGHPDARGLFEEYPRAAYYALRRAFTLPAYAPSTDLAAIRAHFAGIDPAVAAVEARGDQATLVTQTLSRVRLSGLRAEFQTYSTGGHRVTTPEASAPQEALPSFRGFDHLQSFYVDAEVRPSENVTGTLSLNVLGNVPTNPIDEISWESRGRTRTIVADGQPFTLSDVERVKVYRAGLTWDDRWFLLDGFYRTGHYHWGYEGDFFGLYREANYGPNIDTYTADAPIGFEVSGKRALRGLKVAFGPQLWWGANPALLVKYQRAIGPVSAAALYEEDFSGQSRVSTSAAVPQPPTRKATLALTYARGPAVFEVGGIWSGSTKIDDRFQVAERSGDSWTVLEDRVRHSDVLGAKAKVTVERGRLRWYAQAASMGLVADAGPTAVMTFTGWNLKETDSGNQTNFLTGLTYNTGNFQVGPNFLWQKPIVDPMPRGLPSAGPGRPRNILEDPFAVRANRETLGAELLVTYDPTPATWFWQWDNDAREDARLAASLGLVIRDLPTTQDASIGILADGTTQFAFPAAPPARPFSFRRGIWELNSRIVSHPRPDLRIVSHLFFGNAEANGDDPASDFGARLVRRYGGDARVAWGRMVFATHAKANDWGPYDYHRDFNLTFPLQLMGDVAYTLGAPAWLDQEQTRLGVRAAWRSLDEHSSRFVADPAFADPRDAPQGREWEIRTYLVVTL
ncbi:MAG TPA: glycoside hydrolase family 2 TIM barrel-domain containing protein, partial [Candidatus Eisenbacteria bacterium]|nr:glycoside hydrolase family 2 TIM barrel-domain containing protein [Candidatus Eisenbacteria bacterium]